MCSEKVCFENTDIEMSRHRPRFSTIIYNRRNLIIGCLLVLSAKTNALENCPPWCDCISAFGSLSYSEVNCSGSQLSHFDQLHLPIKIRKLFISDTSLSEIPSKYFYNRGTTTLSQLYLSRNEIKEISADSFDGLDNLNYLDLSYNRIKHLSNASINNNPSLRFLSLRGTRVPIPSDSSLVISNSLERMDLSDNKIVELPQMIFYRNPSLKFLNLSYNPIKSISERTLQPLRNLRMLDLRHTLIKCDALWKLTLNWFREKSINVISHPCDFNTMEEPKEENLSTMIMLPTVQNDEFSQISYTTAVYDEHEIMTHRALRVVLAYSIGFFCGIVIALGATACLLYACCRKRNEPTNEVVSADDDFHLVETPFRDERMISDEPPRYSSLFSTRYQKVLPSAPPLLHS